MSLASGERLGRRAGWRTPAAGGWRVLLVWLSAALVVALLALAVWVSLPPELRQLPGSFGANQPADFSTNAPARFAPQRPAGSTGSAS